MNNETLTLIAPSETAAPAASPIHSTRNGKIARLPAEIRQELNQRLLDGEPVPPSSIGSMLCRAFRPSCSASLADAR